MQEMPQEPLPKVYRAQETEKKWYAKWEKQGYFRPELNPKGDPYTIVIPPPNVTGILHMGHALNNTIQDMMARFRRMQGRAVLWLPGTDHAGIATQNVVERSLAREGKKRRDLGREAFVKRVWDWKEKHGSTINLQLRELGASLDWSRERFTMDEGLSEAVQKVFVQLHRKKLIFRGVYLVNWCPRCQTALSDEESEHREVAGHLWHIRYPLKPLNPRSTIHERRTTNDERQAEEFLVVATTRPETMLGDTACAVHPKDKKNAYLKGRKAILPIIGRELDIVADTVVDPEFGSGVVKITPAHDPNDFALGQRHHLAAVNVLNPDGTLNENAGPYQGKDRFAARKAIIERLKSEGLLVKVEDHLHAVGHCYRCHTVVEPYLTDQWFVRLGDLAKKALKQGGVCFYPQRWNKVYLNWMKKTGDWCISRQIWWGHRIPAWYCVTCYEKTRARFFSQPLDFTGGMDEEEAGIRVGPQRPQTCLRCKGSEFRQDEDVLDTWFSSWLWPFSTLGWPDKTQDLKRYYPTNDLVTAPEIIFFWVARMIMAGVHFMNKVPFQNIYIHGTVRDDTGKKMSKSLGNVIDPLHIVEEVGADALRYSLVSLGGTGQDLYLSKDKFAVGRNFTNKIWNAARFVLMNIQDGPKMVETQQGGLNLSDRWILSRLAHTTQEVTHSLEHFRFSEAAHTLYDFIWHQFCDWYLELAKPRIQEPAVQKILVTCLDQALRLLHPVMPFLTEEIWQKIPHEGDSLMQVDWPKPDKAQQDPDVERQMGVLMTTIIACRNIRSEWNIPQGANTRTTLLVAQHKLRDIFKENADIMKRLAKIEQLSISGPDTRVAQAATAVTDDCVVKTELGSFVDLEKERKRLLSELEETEWVAKKLRERLLNQDFLSRAPGAVVEKERGRLKELEERTARFQTNLKALEG